MKKPRLIARSLAPISFATASLAGASGCGEAGDVWEAPPALAGEAVGLRSSVAVVDAAADRVLLLRVDAEGELASLPVTIGPGHVRAAATPDGEHLLVLSRGVVPRRSSADAGPSLFVIDDATAAPRPRTTFALDNPHSGLAVDPMGELAVVYSDGTDAAFAENPNQLAIARIDEPPGAANPRALTLRSFGGRPQGFAFTPPLELPPGDRRLLLVHTEHDLAIVDLDDPSVPDITVRLSTSGEPRKPSDIAVSDGQDGDTEDARIAIAIENDASIVVVDLASPIASDPDVPQGFRAVPSLAFVGGPASDVEFVETDGGERLAALVPSKSALVLLDPSSGITSQIDLGAPFDRLSTITDIVGSAGAADVALLWSSSSADIAFVSLGGAVGKPYQSVERLELSHPVAGVRPVAGQGAHLELLSSPDGSRFTVLDLIQRTASPIEAAVSGAELFPARDGSRAWLYAEGGSDLAKLDLMTLEPHNLLLSHPVSHVFDVERAGGGRSLVALHPVGALGVTVMDAEQPTIGSAIEYAGVLLGRLL